MKVFVNKLLIHFNFYKIKKNYKKSKKKKVNKEYISNKIYSFFKFKM
jgi:hypothetical protein